ncbi:hypothetical protein Cphy_2167 [Lachnoclostridium phytofermentans ISDg]|uniref:HTH araC/xylS-type domain-containing protein n=1 Tax=Lachnoclostridium phytofermentans (strain ATCC 700394 / DSM 18823 / ISDg) TaxID=357809 RepID=A9KJC1_LACP7|nr:hypothetical protein Cphy_2167 [Lachnoclostridium phytofermentans ISDg]
MEMILDYIEEHLIETIYFDEIAKIGCCSNYNFLRVFSFYMEISLTGYNKNIRMSVAADELREYIMLFRRGICKCIMKSVISRL